VSVDELKDETAAEEGIIGESGPAAAAEESGGTAFNADDFVVEKAPVETDRNKLKAILEAVIYVTDEPLTAQQIAAAVNSPIDEVRSMLDELTAEYSKPDRGLSIREIAGGYKMATKAEHHEAVRAFVRNLKPPLKLSLAALETLAVIAYKQPVTGPEIMEIRGVQGLGVLKTLIDRKLIATAGRKNVVGKPILYKTTREFLVQFGLKDLAELPTLKEFEELGRLAMSEGEPEPAGPADDAPVKEPPATEPPRDEPGEKQEEPPAGDPPVDAPPEQAEEAAQDAEPGKPSAASAETNG
jgi:segregation and condensation protein B